jgi:hypothetical protein
VLATATLDCAVVMQKEKLAAARAFEDPFGALYLEVVELDHVAQWISQMKRAAVREPL